jgi:hypothetical protein
VDQDLLQVEKSCVVVSKEFVASFAKSFSILLLFCARQFGYLTRFIYFSFDMCTPGAVPAALLPGQLLGLAGSGTPYLV